ncbi:MAG TPA: asparagine synthase C-terminal domain-containing protein [Steroidobacter sp.]
MFRYVALIWNTADEQQSGTAAVLAQRLRALGPGWSKVFEQRGLQVHCADAHPPSLETQVLPNNAGVIMGTLLARHHDPANEQACAKARIGPTEAERIVATRGNWLIEHAWGNYVAMWQEPNGPRKWILKDPAGALPCFLTSFAQITVVFSNLGDALAMALGPWPVNRYYLSARLMSIGEALDQSPLQGIAQIRRGECVELHPVTMTAPRTEFLWNPLRFMHKFEAIDDADTAARLMRATVLACTRALARNHTSILHRLSGGLDSSMVLAALKDDSARPRICCYTYYNPRGRSDERPWARMAARGACDEHIELAVAPSDIDLVEALRMPPLVEPTPVMGYIHRAIVERRLATEQYATAVFNGDGGDSGFCGDSFAHAASSFLTRHGVRRELFRIATQVALRSERSVGRVLLEAIRQRFHRPCMEEQLGAIRASSMLVSRALRESFGPPRRYPHPWFDDLDHVPWEAIWRVGMLIATPDFYNVADPTDFAPEVIAPLYSQPVVELLLRIPVYRHFEGGRDRGLARRAFEAEVPRAILRRQWKDRAPGFHDELIDHNPDFLRELFLDGVLVREGLLDRAMLEQTLSTRVTRSAVLPAEIFKHLEVEIWARRWLR